MPSLVRAFLIAAVAATVVVGCGRGHRPDADPWLAERGAKADTWHTCVRIGAALRAACGGDADCETGVTTDVTRPCYVARYRAETAPVQPAHDSPPETLSPCFWDRVEPRPASPEAYARAQCATLALSPELAPHCEAELRTVILGLCTEGSTDLTGAGP
jgi:hypothetical protein